MFYYGVLGSILPFIGLSIYSAVTNEPMYVLTDYPKAFSWLLLGSICDMSFVICLIIAFQSDTTGFVSLISYTGIIWGFIADLVLFKQSFTVI